MATRRGARSLNIPRASPVTSEFLTRHVFQKKAKKGSATPKTDLDLIRERLKAAEAAAREMKP